MRMWCATGDLPSWFHLQGRASRSRHTWSQISLTIREAQSQWFRICNYAFVTLAGASLMLPQSTEWQGGSKIFWEIWLVTKAYNIPRDLVQGVPFGHRPWLGWLRFGCSTSCAGSGKFQIQVNVTQSVNKLDALYLSMAIYRVFIYLFIYLSHPHLSVTLSYSYS